MISEGMVAIFIPIVTLLVVGIIAVSYIYFSSREKQLLINRGFSLDELKVYFFKKSDNYMQYRIGILSVFLAFGILFGNMAYELTNKEYFSAFYIILFIGLGFIAGQVLIDFYLKKKKKAEMAEDESKKIL